MQRRSLRRANYTGINFHVARDEDAVKSLAGFPALCARGEVAKMGRSSERLRDNSEYRDPAYKNASAYLHAVGNAPSYISPSTSLVRH